MRRRGGLRGAAFDLGTGEGGGAQGRLGEPLGGGGVAERGVDRCGNLGEAAVWVRPR